MEKIAKEIKEIADNQGKLKQGKGSQKQVSILVMIESKPVLTQKHLLQQMEPITTMILKTTRKIIKQ